jgi:hypothetical protein
METGVKPIIANYIDAERVIPEKYLFNTVEECVTKVTDNDFNRTEYRDYVETNHDFERQVAEIGSLIESLLREYHQANDNNSESPHRNTVDDWDILIHESRFLTPDDLNLFTEKLHTSKAEIIKVKVVYPIVEDHLIGRWEIAAISKRIKTNREEFADCRAICEEEIHLPYNDALELFIAKDFAGALNKFVQHYQIAKNSTEKTVYARWLALCLIELKRDRDALNVLGDSIQLVSDNSDLYYLYLLASLLSNETDRIQSIIDNISDLGDATSYPEFICDVQIKADELMQQINIKSISA